MKSVCIKRPSVLKHFQQLLLDKNGEAIRILMEAPEFFDDNSFSGTEHIDNPSSSPSETPLEDSDDRTINDQVNSLHLGVNEYDFDDVSSSVDVISCITDHDDSVMPQWNNQCDPMTILSINDPIAMHDSVKFIDQHSEPRVQVNGGADRSITPHRELVHHFRLPNPSAGDKTHINDAGVHAHRIVGYGYFRVRCLDSSSKPHYIEVPCAYIPSIPSTLLNFRTMPRLINVNEISNMLLGVGAANLTLLDSNDDPYQLLVPLIVYKTRLYADQALIRCENEFTIPSSTCPSAT
jgi:hypothetical protein